MTYASEVLADSPIGYYKLNEASGSSFANSASGLGTGALTGTVATYGVASPPGDGITWPTTSAYITCGSSSTVPGVVSYEAWVYFSSMPGAFSASIISSSATYNSSTTDKNLRVNADGSVSWYVYNGATQMISSAAGVITTGSWFQIVATVGAGGQKIYVNGTQVATGAATTGASFAGFFFIHGNGGFPSGGGYDSQQYRMSSVSIYDSQLSAARALAHYNAAVETTGTLAGTVSAVTGAFRLEDGFPVTVSAKGTWLRAKSNTGANGSSVTSWPNSVDPTRPAQAQGTTTPTVVTGATPNGGKSVQFSNGRFEMDNVFGSTTAGLAVGIIKSTEFSTEPASYAFDGVTTTKWSTLTGNTTGYIGLRLAAAYVATQYTTRGYGGNQDARSWTFQGSNDNSNWTTLDTRTLITVTGADQVWSFSNSTAYLYYRLNITANAGNGSLLSLVTFDITGVTYGYSGSAEAWIVAKSESSGNQAIWSYNEGIASNAHDLYPLSTGGVYSTFGVGTASAQSFSTTTFPVLNTWRLYYVTNDGTNLKVYLDGALRATHAVSGMGGISWPRVMSALLGTGRTSRLPSFVWTGEVAEHLTRGTISSLAEISDFINYFNTEHGLTVPGGSTLATLGGTTPTITGAFTADLVALTNNASLSGTVSAVTGSFTSSGTQTATLAGATAAVEGQFSATTVYGSLAGSTPAVLGSFSAFKIQPVLSGTTPGPLTSTLSATRVTLARLAGTTPRAMKNKNVTYGPVRVQFTATVPRVVILQGTTPAVLGAFQLVLYRDSTLAGVVPMPVTAALVADQGLTATLNGTVPNPVLGEFEIDANFGTYLQGETPAVTGILSANVLYEATLEATVSPLIGSLILANLPPDVLGFPVQNPSVTVEPYSGTVRILEGTHG